MSLAAQKELSLTYMGEWLFQYGQWVLFFDFYKIGMGSANKCEAPSPGPGLRLFLSVCLQRVQSSRRKEVGSKDYCNSGPGSYHQEVESLPVADAWKGQEGWLLSLKALLDGRNWSGKVSGSRWCVCVLRSRTLVFMLTQQLFSVLCQLSNLCWFIFTLSCYESDAP